MDEKNHGVKSYDFRDISTYRWIVPDVETWGNIERHSVTFLKITVFTNTAVRTSNLVKQRASF
jgi:hypothetical protein